MSLPGARGAEEEQAWSLARTGGGVARDGRVIGLDLPALLAQAQEMNTPAVGELLIVAELGVREGISDWQQHPGEAF